MKGNKGIAQRKVRKNEMEYSKEEVIEGLECCQDIARTGNWQSGCISCPYRKHKNKEDKFETCKERLLKDAKTIITEPVKKVLVKKMFSCPYCNAVLCVPDKEHGKIYCGGCGQEIEW